MRLDNQIYLSLCKFIIAVFMCGLLSSCANSKTVKYEYYNKSRAEQAEQDVDSITGMRPYSIF